ncbi:hypothetical protein PVK06_047738 [Gossypium arboreum]|uniref:DUF4283 domain-containing protein n=1 Tax=Gossypium arboreum TaxID=29729 RepID=A0ABR0ME14_GOSAR|nr:hypothetical protein PVK06_047738 [Gossypium arboreum]
MENSLPVDDISSLPEDEDGGGNRVVSDRNTKKVQLKNGSEEEITHMVVESSTGPTISWKDKLLGVTSVSLNKKGLESPGVSTGEELEFLDGDIHRSFVNGIPTIDFSERIHQILFKEMESIVVLKLFGRNIGYGALHSCINSLWNPSMPFYIMDIENGYFLAKFQSIDDYAKVLS